MTTPRERLYAEARAISKRRPCPYCGGRYSPGMGRIYHKGHPRDCYEKARQDRIKDELTGSMPERHPCGCLSAMDSHSWDCADNPYYEVGEEHYEEVEP